MSRIRCPFCHEVVPEDEYPAHKRAHTRALADGQMTDHITLAPGGRYTGSLRGVPQVYRHPKCGGRTGMPEEIIRSYLADPLLYNDNSFCCGCGTYVRMDHLFWVETGEAVLDYLRQLRRVAVREHLGIDLDGWLTPLVVITPAAGRAIRRLAADRRLDPESVAVGVSFAEERPGLYFDLSLFPRADEPGHLRLEWEAYRVLVPADQADRLGGVLVDHKDIGEKPRFDLKSVLG